MICKNKIFCQAMDINNQSSKEIFMGFIQGSTRMCTVWHYPFVIEPLSHFGQQPVQAIISIKFTSEQTIHQAREKKEWSSLFLGTKMTYKHSYFRMHKQFVYKWCAISS